MGALTSSLHHHAKAEGDRDCRSSSTAAAGGGKKRPLEPSSSSSEFHPLVPAPPIVPADTWVLPRTREACEQIPNVPPGVCSSIRENNADRLKEALGQVTDVSPQVLTLVFRYAALLGDDQGMRVIANRMKQLNVAVPADAFSYARDVTPHAGLGGHTLAAVFARTLYLEQQERLRQLQRPTAAAADDDAGRWDRLEVDPLSDWEKCATEGQELCGHIVTNDAHGLRLHIRWLKTQRTGEEVAAALRAALLYAAYLGDDVGIQVLVQEGAAVDAEAVRAAADRHPSLPGVGGHTFAAMYLQALRDKQFSPYVPLTKLRFASTLAPKKAT